jgi:hypothetical protein
MYRAARVVQVRNWAILPGGRIPQAAGWIRSTTAVSPGTSQRTVWPAADTVVRWEAGYSWLTWKFPFAVNPMLSSVNANSPDNLLLPELNRKTSPRSPSTCADPSTLPAAGQSGRSFRTFRYSMFWRPHASHLRIWALSAAGMPDLVGR